MGVNDELTPREHDAMRETLLAGARRIKPVGAHRMQIIAGAVALTLVAGVAGGAIAAANLFGSAEIPPVTTPSPTVTESATPTPTPTPTSTPTSTPIPTAQPALGGDCANVLSAAEVASNSGEGLQLRAPAIADDPGTIGGISCSWQPMEAIGNSDWRYLDVAVYPASVIPDDVAADSGVVVDCLIGGCEYSEFHGDAWVVGSAETMEQAMAAVRLVGPRAAASPGVPAPRPADAWHSIDCASVEGVVGPALGRDDFTPYAGDAMPFGQEWTVLVENDVAAWCSVLGVGTETLSEQVTFDIGPGATDIEPGWADAAPVPVAVAGASVAWVVDSTSVLAVTDGNAILVSARFLTPDQIVAVTEQAIAVLDASRGM